MSLKYWRSVLAASTSVALAACAGAPPASESTPAPEPPSVVRDTSAVVPAPDTVQIVRVDTVVLSPPEPPRDIRVCAGGDVLLGNNLDTTWAVRASSRLGRPVSSTPNADALLEPLRPLVADADIILLNIEGAIGEGAASSKCRPRSRNCYAFRQPVATAGALRRLGEGAEVIGNVANNHAMDAGHLGFQATQRHLEAAGVYTTGTDTLATVVVTAAGDSVAFLGFSTATAGPDPRDLSAVRRHVARAVSNHSLVVVTMHMGAEGVSAQRTPNEAEPYLGEDRGNSIAFAHAAVDAGAATVLGHGPHVMRGVEWYGGSLIFYSLGNLLTYGPFSLVEPLNRGGIACVKLGVDGGVQGAVLRSTWQQPPGILQPDPTGRAGFLVDSLSRLDFPGTAARLVGEAAVLRSR